MGALNRATRELATSRGIRSHLTGQGSDCVLHKGNPPPIYLADWFRQGRLRDWSRHLQAYLNRGSFNAWQLLRECTLGTVDPQLGVRAPIPAWVTPTFRKEIEQARVEFLYTQKRTLRSHAKERMYRFTLCFIPYHRGAVADERLPLVHRPLVEFLLGLEWNFVVAPNTERLLMRRSLGGVLPELASSTKECRTAYGAALYEGLRTAWPRVSPFVTGERLAELGVVELRQFRAAIDAMKAGYEGPNPQIGRTALYLETWLGLKTLMA